TTDESALIIEIVDPKVKKSIWQASVDLKSKNKKQSQLDNLKSNVEILFNTYLHLANTSEIDQTLTKTND
ncbi:MAG: alanine dehydrogenase, partial [Marinoscillum sp.]